MSYSPKEIRRITLHLNEPRQTNKFGTYDTRCIYRELIKEDVEIKLITESQFTKVLFRINELLLDSLFNGSVLKFPYQMGELILVSGESKPKFKDGKLKINMAVDWHNTYELWANNDAALQNKTLVYYKPCTFYKLHYSYKTAKYRNMKYYSFYPYRSVKQKIKSKVINNDINKVYSL